MSTICVATNCKRVSRALCYICQKSLCREHFDEHDHSFNKLLNTLKDQIKDIDDRLDDLNNDEHLETYYEILDKWRDDSYKIIDRLYEKKCQEIKRRFYDNINEQQEKVNQLNLDINQILQEQDVTQKTVDLFKINIENLRNQMNKLEQTKFNIDIHPLILDNHTITIEEINTTYLNLQQITHPHQIIQCSNNSTKPLAHNNEFLLIYQMQNLCLINHDLILVKQIPWIHGRIWDICWSSTLNRFIILAHYEIYLIDIKTMSIEHMENILPRRNWWSCTCSNTSLFLSTYEYGSSIIELNFSTKQWTNHLICNKNEFIKDIIYNNQTIAITIYNKKFSTKSIQLRSTVKFDFIWSYQLDIQGQCHNTLRCCSLDNNQWLITDFDHQRLFHITNEGKLKTIYNYYENPWYINLFHRNILVISTKNSINFHKL